MNKEQTAKIKKLAIVYYPIDESCNESDIIKQDSKRQAFIKGYTERYLRENSTLPSDKEVEEWFVDNIDNDSASSAIYKFRLWLKDLAQSLKGEGEKEKDFTQAIIDAINAGKTEFEFKGEMHPLHEFNLAPNE